MTIRTSPGIYFFVGVALMLFGVVGAGLSYREMRAQRVLHEPVHIFRLDPSSPSAWLTAPLSLYQNGAHAVILSLSSPATGPTTQPFRGAIAVVIANPQGKEMMNVTRSSFTAGISQPDRLRWFPIDTLIVGHITSSEWKIQTKILSGDPQFAGSLAEIVVLPPRMEEFAAYLRSNAYKLYGAGILIVGGFLLLIYGARQKVEMAP